ncbi:DUF1428 domain-containing protein [Simiduia aestuariiviva]|uniref:Uncharacterized protein YbaA (DUF1428 family) n=1 Tax=Simiduia aestuariiviva TaxID=1510459 RepID=A0A839UKK2_9GAMM|nr:DUF1428 domain-containing protein [Simiduia aestuariiviva]MBB3167301.1 uncharacterized protein YbaA (DUF1428 family) [Simiduia aestuariiviva]
MPPYIDGFLLSIPRAQLATYRAVVEQVAEIWKEHGALEYVENVDDDAGLEGTRPFADFANAKADEVVIFGWVAFESRAARDLVNKRVAADPRMEALVSPLTNGERPIFDARRMVYGGFKPLV